MQYPPIPQRKSCDCSDPCISTDDVYYAGPNLPNSGVNTSDLLTEVIEKLDAIYAVPTLQRVTEMGNYTTLPIIADSFVKIGGDGTNLLLDNGDVLSIGDLPVGVTETSQLINDGQDGVDPYITLLDVPSQVVEADSYDLFPEFGESNVIYVTLDTYKLYIWEGYYVEVGLSVTNLSYVQGTANGFIDNSNGSGAELQLADEIYAGLLSPDGFITLSDTSGTNTGDQDLQQVTDIGASTTNPITITVGDGGANGLSSFSSQGYGIRGESSETIAIYGTSISTGVYGEGNTGVYAYSAGGTGIEVYGNGGVGISVNLGNSNKGLVINSGASSTGNPIEIVKSDDIKFTINQQGEQSIVKIPGGTGTNVLLDNGTTAAVSSLGSQNLQEVTAQGADTTIPIRILANTNGNSLEVYNNAITGSSAIYGIGYGIGVYGYTFADRGVYGFAESGIGVKGYCESGLGGEFEIDGSGNIVNFKTSGVLKASVGNDGEITANSFIKDGGSSSEILMADGSIITAGTNITINGGQISSTGGGGGGGGSSVSYYLNGGTAASVAGYYQFSQSAVVGTGVDFSLTGDGLISQWLTDVGDPNKLEILGGNWNFETYMSVSTTGGSPGFYIELLKYDGTTFTTIANNSGTPEIITTTAIDIYFSSLGIPQTTLLATDRLVLRYYIVNASGRTITMHTQDSHLCQVITNFANGIIYLNGLNASSQNFGIATTGADFNIVSSGSTHTFNLPSASSIHRGALTSADWTIFNNKQNALSGIGLVRLTGTSLTYDNSIYLTSVGIANLTATGTPSATTFLRGDNTWATVTGGSGTVTSVTGTAPISVTSSTTTPVISMTAASTSVNGYLTSANFTIFNNKASLDSPAFINSPTAPTQATGLSNTTLATTAFVTNSINTAIPNIGYTIYNILIGSGTGMASITTQEPGTSGGQPYAQNGRNVMINNGGSAINIDATLAVDGFIASYTKLGTANVTFTVTSPVVFLNNVNGAVMYGFPGSTALLTKNGNTVYLLINNI